jgi:NADPH:quinone reductase-like Zn-dependent oxidoreductase
MSTYRAAVVEHRGGSEAIRFEEKELRPPGPGEARLRMLAAPVVQDDVATRVGNRPFLPKTPFVPGYSVIGEVEALGSGVASVGLGDRVGALTQLGSHAEKVYWPAADLVAVPQSLDPAQASVLILNYLVAFQILHRVAKVKTGDRLLVIGASGGVGTAFLDLGRQAGLETAGLASAAKHEPLREFGAFLVDYHDPGFIDAIKESTPAGFDYVVNGMGEEYLGPGMRLLRRGGTLIHYGGPQSLPRFFGLLVLFGWYNLLPNGKRVAGYGTHRLGVDKFKPDWTTLFEWLGRGEITPVIAARFPLSQIRQANELVESGRAVGGVILLGEGKN